MMITDFPVLVDGPPPELFRMAEEAPLIHLEGASLGIPAFIAGIGRFLFSPGILVPAGLLGGGFVLSEILGIDFSNLLPSVLLGSGSAALFTLKGAFPESFSPFLTVGGIGLGVASLLTLFSGTARGAEAKEPTGLPDTIEPPKVPPGQEVPNLPLGQLAELLNVSAIPADLQPDGPEWSRLMSHIFQFRARNNGNRTLSFFAGAAVFDASTLALRHRTPEADRILVTLAPGESTTIDLFIPNAAQFAQRPMGLFTEDTAVEGQVFRERDSGTVALRTDAIGIRWTVIG